MRPLSVVKVVTAWIAVPIPIVSRTSSTWWSSTSTDIRRSTAVLDGLSFTELCKEFDENTVLINSPTYVGGNKKDGRGSALEDRADDSDRFARSSSIPHSVSALPARVLEIEFPTPVGVDQ